MDKLWQFACDPTLVKWNEIQKSGKLKSNLGEAFTTWENFILYDSDGIPGWPILTEAESNDRHEQFKLDNIDAISKLIARPRFGLLMKAWGLFLATGEIQYLSAAYEVAGNMRAGNGLKHEAIKLYTDIKELYMSYIFARTGDAELPACVKSFNAYEKIIDEKRQLLDATHQNINLARKELHRDTMTDKVSLNELLQHLSAHETLEKNPKTAKTRAPTATEAPDTEPSAEDMDQFEAIARDVVNKIR